MTRRATVRQIAPADADAWLRALPPPPPWRRRRRRLPLLMLAIVLIGLIEVAGAVVLLETIAARMETIQRTTP